MPKEKIAFKVFQPFFTTKSTDQRNELGLSLSYDLMEAPIGEFSVSSLPGETKFEIVIPI